MPNRFITVVLCGLLVSLPVSTQAQQEATGDTPVPVEEPLSAENFFGAPAPSQTTPTIEPEATPASKIDEGNSTTTQAPETPTAKLPAGEIDEPQLNTPEQESPEAGSGILGVLGRAFGFSSEPVAELIITPGDVGDPFGSTWATHDTGIISEDSTGEEFNAAKQNLDLVEDYDSAIALSQLHRRPVLLIFGADWCTWCKKLEADLESDSGDLLRKQWVIAKIDVDAHPEVASQFRASALPSLNILGLDHKSIASHEGYMAPAELDAWLTEHSGDADPKVANVLYGSGVSSSDQEKLVEYLGHRTASIRAAAQQRLIAARQSAAPIVVTTLRDGSLAQKLSALAILERWNAPTHDIDPWVPQSLSADRLSPLVKWAQEHASGENAPEPDAEVSPDTVEDLISKLLSATPQTQAAILARTSSLATATQTTSNQMGGLQMALATAVRARLASPDSYSDGQRILLRELLYGVLAGRKTRLEQSNLINAMASIKADRHQAAARKLTQVLNRDDRPLIDQLSRDTDELIRESTVARMQELKILQEADVLQRLLSDSSPSVRTAVLRAIGDDPSENSTTALIEYLDQESDENLLVYATKTLGLLGTDGNPHEALYDMVADRRWRVRAAALDAIAESLGDQRYSMYSGQTKAVANKAAEAVLDALKDEDPFVASKAKLVLPTIVATNTSKMIAELILENPDFVAIIIAETEPYEREEKLAPLVKQFSRWMKQPEDSSRYIASASAIAAMQPTALQNHFSDLLQLPQPEGRIIAQKAFVAALTKWRESELESAVATWQSPPRDQNFDSWYPVPEELKTRAQAANPQSQPAVQDSDKNDANIARQTRTDDEATMGTDSDFANSFFGGSSTGAAVPEMESDTENSPADFSAALSLFGALLATPDNEDPDSGEKSQLPPLIPIASKWLAAWQEDTDHKSARSWIRHTTAQLKSLNNSKNVTSDNREWLTLRIALLASGDTSGAAEVVTGIEQLADVAKQLELARLAMPWLPESLRRQLLESCTKDWPEGSSPTKPQLEFLQYAAKTDSLLIADWLFDNLVPRFSMPVAYSQALIGSALFGLEDSLNMSFSLSELEDQNQPFSWRSTTRKPGTGEALAWLNKRFKTAQSPTQRAQLISLVSFLDHRLATQSAVGFVEQATQDDLMLEACLSIALNDVPADAADRSLRWLDHALPKVQTKAVERLAELGSSSWPDRDTIYTAVFHDYNDETPVYSHLKRPLPKSKLNQLFESEAFANNKSLKLLLLAAGDKTLSLTEARELISDEDDAISLVHAYAKAGRTDTDAIELYRSVLSENDNYGVPAAVYKAIRGLTGEEITAFRKKLRSAYGSNLFD